MSLVVMGGMGANCDGTCVGGKYPRRVPNGVMLPGGKTDSGIILSLGNWASGW